MQVRIDSIPQEVFSLIQQFLDQDALYNCILVCKNWNQLFFPSLFKHIRIGVSGYKSFITLKNLENIIFYYRDIQSLKSSHPFFILTLLNSLDLAGHPKPYFPNLTTLAISFSIDVQKSLLVSEQPQFYYPSDYEDSEDDTDYETDQDTNMNSTPIDPTQGKYKELYKTFGTTLGENCLSFDQYGVVDLLRQCPNLVDFTIDVGAMGQYEGLCHLLWPGIIPTSIERLEIITPHNWIEDLKNDPLDEDYNPELYPPRDVDEEFEEDDDEFISEIRNNSGGSDRNDGCIEGEEDNYYNEDELVEWYLSNLNIPSSPPLWHTTDSTEGFFTSRRKVPSIHLRELVLYNTEDIRFPVLRFIGFFCTKIDTLHLINPSQRFCHNFVHKPPEFKNLIFDIQSVDEWITEEAIGFLLGGGYWESISIKNYFSYGMRTVVNIAANKNLQELNFNINAGSIKSMEIQSILRNVPTLKVLRGRSLYMFARTFGQIPWSCINNLEVFQCQILFEILRIDSSIEEPEIVYWDEKVMNMGIWGFGIFPPSDPPTIDSLSGVDGRYCELQQRVMRNLGQCYHLRELDLSHWFPEDGEIRGPNGVMGYNLGCLELSAGLSNVNIAVPWKLKSQKKSLEFTLENGLEELEGLKDLRQLNIENLEHRISVRELRWMREAWPDLENIKGLFSNTENDDLSIDESEVKESREERRVREYDMRCWLYGGLEDKDNKSFWRTSEIEM